MLSRRRRFKETTMTVTRDHLTPLIIQMRRLLGIVISLGRSINQLNPLEYGKVSSASTGPGPGTGTANLGSVGWLSLDRAGRVP